MYLQEYATKIMNEQGIDAYTYNGSEQKRPDDVLGDLIKAYPDGMEYPYIDVANAILSMSHPRPIVRRKYDIFYEIESTTGVVYFDTLEEAKKATFEMYKDWMLEATNAIKNIEHSPVEEKYHIWWEMLYGRSATVEQYIPEEDDYDQVWFPSSEELDSIGWTELTGALIAQSISI